MTFRAHAYPPRPLTVWYPEDMEGKGLGTGFSTLVALEAFKFIDGSKLRQAPLGSGWNIAHSYWLNNYADIGQALDLRAQAYEEVDILGNYLWKCYGDHIIRSNPPTLPWSHAFKCKLIFTISAIFILLAVSITIIALAARGKLK